MEQMPINFEEEKRERIDAHDIKTVEDAEEFLRFDHWDHERYAAMHDKEIKKEAEDLLKRLQADQRAYGQSYDPSRDRYRD